MRQVSPESEHIYDLIITLYKHCNGDWKKLQSDSNLSDDEMQHFLDYAAQFLGNTGNYKSFGDSKFVPRLEPSKLKILASSSQRASKFYEQIEARIYESEPVSLMHLGYPDDGHLSNYYPHSPNISREEISLVSAFLEHKKVLPENTRLQKTKSGDFELLISCADRKPSADDRDTLDTEWSLDGKLEGKKLSLRYGDHSENMKKAADSIGNAAKNALNETQRSMHQEYEKSFLHGSLRAFKQSQRYWIRDKGPMVECNIGFIETYRDPHGIRGEWEGFVAMINKERTKAFGKLVDAAPRLIPKLPWGQDFEKDKFLSPDFTSLEVLTFAGSGIPGQF